MIPLKSLCLAAVALLSMPILHSAQVAVRLGKDPLILAEYGGTNYPVSKTRMNLVHYDGDITVAKTNFFNTKTALIEIGVYENGGEFTGAEVVQKIRQYEAKNMRVAGVFVYREDWLPQIGGTGGPHAIDRRLLSNVEVQRIRNAISNGNLLSTNIKLIQLIGGRVHGQRGDSWSRMTPERKAVIAGLFDGVAIECHIGDEVATANFPDGPTTLIAMAEVTEWAKANSKQALVFMGGLPSTYQNLAATQVTYRKLWAHMNGKAVGKNAPHVIYFRQGARAGEHTPESAGNTLTHQMRWLINEVD